MVRYWRLRYARAPFEDAVGNIPHFGSTRIFSHHIASQIDRENDRNNANNDYWREIRTDVVQVPLLESCMREPAFAESSIAVYPVTHKKWLNCTRNGSAWKGHSQTCAAGSFGTCAEFTIV